MAVHSAVAIVVAFGVVGLRRVDEGQSGSPEMSSVACSSEIKEDGLRFVERQRGDHNSFKVAGFESKERLCSSEIKECQRGQHDDHQPQSRWF